MPSAQPLSSFAVPASGTSGAAAPSSGVHTWIVMGDLHDKAARLGEIQGLEEADGIIVTGDLTVTGGAAQARNVLEKLTRYNPVIYAQIGNMDRAEVTDWLAKQGWNTHLCVRELAPGVALMGLGGSTFTPFGTPSEFPESRFADWLEHMWREARTYRHVVLSVHTPPHDTLCDIVGDGIHVGSSAVRDFILDAQPDVCLCGHIHESRAVDRLGRTVLVNPGAFATGGYARPAACGGRPVGDASHAGLTGSPGSSLPRPDRWPVRAQGHLSPPEKFFGNPRLAALARLPYSPERLSPARPVCMGLLRRRRATGASEPAIFAAAPRQPDGTPILFVFLRKHMTDSEKIAAPGGTAGCVRKAHGRRCGCR